MGNTLVADRPKNKGMRRLIKAFGYSVAGLNAAWQNEEAFRIEVLIMLFVIPVGWWLGANSIQRALLIGVYFIILITELVNSAIEAVVDCVGKDPHVLAGRAKDLGSAAVLVSITTCIVVWGIIVYGRFFP
jgi:diacylglycerol kinase (ATP)